jgi:hypothetical protein
MHNLNAARDPTSCDAARDIALHITASEFVI